MDIVTNYPVLVTGGAGFIAGHIIQQLLLKGYKVRTTLRTMSDREAFQHLFQLQNVDNLEIIEADLNDSSMWPYAFSGGIEYVIHVAAPYILKPADPESELIAPIVLGMNLILEMCRSTKSVKKLVFTSCLCAVADEFDNDKDYTENDWNDASSVTRNSFAFCKTTAERTAWKFVQTDDCQFQLVAILPGVVLGPHTGNKLAVSHRYLLAFLTKKFRGVPDLHYCIADVRDVAHAHIIALENPEVIGRYILCNAPTPLSEVLDLVRNNFSDIDIPNKKVSNMAVRIFMATDKTFRGEFLRHNIANMTTIQAKMRLRPVEQTIEDTVQFFVSNGIIESELSGKNNTCVLS